MSEPFEDSLPPSGPSIELNRSPLLGSLCRVVAAAPPPDRLAAALDRIVRFTGTDRAFVAEREGAGGRSAPRVVARFVRPMRDSREPSRTILARAVAAARVFVSASPADDPRIGDAPSVRALRLGFVAAFPIPRRRGSTAALVLESDRALSRERAARVETGAGAVGPLLSILLDGPRLPLRDDGARSRLVGRSPAFLEAIDDARRAAGTGVPVLLLGETGSGKEEFARLVHRDGPRRDGPFVPVNCAALPETLLESELFGAVRGAFTGARDDRPGLLAAADGGTLFLDEIGEMSAGLQAKVLRVLQDGRVRPVGARCEREVDVRVVAATHRDLLERIRAGGFRADLYWRLAVSVVRIPPLRDRPGDLDLLARALIERLSSRWGLPDGRLDEAAVRILAAHPWPGNVRELESVLARALLRADGGTIRPEHLRFDPGPHPTRPEGPDSLEARMIRDALRQSRGVLSAAAARIGWSRQKLYRRMGVLGISRPSASPGEEP
jgi:transcriptional regulator of acetoin/glycerol metabolism